VNITCLPAEVKDVLAAGTVSIIDASSSQISVAASPRPSVVNCADAALSSCHTRAGGRLDRYFLAGVAR